jgi:chemotaxis protein MotB
VAGKGGGAWKVAYADFVTAMMAFFLVMWIVGQDQKVRKAVSDYFGDPFAVNNGVSKSPYRAGSLFDTLRTGTVPDADRAALGKGRHSHTTHGEKSRITQLVTDWLHRDDEALTQWKDKARLELSRVAPPKDADKRKIDEAEEVAIRRLTMRISDEIRKDVPPELKGIYYELLDEAIKTVNWREVAEDLLTD